VLLTTNRNSLSSQRVWKSMLAKMFFYDVLCKTNREKHNGQRMDLPWVGIVH
ncbi:hypothetical protein SK128_022521, partial [Halocaridina rubra]